jgi:hypothetical protein
MLGEIGFPHEAGDKPADNAFDVSLTSFW